MKIDQFLKHHGIGSNPFSEEDAAGADAVFKRACLETIHHPAWDKFFHGSPAEPSTAPGLRREGQAAERRPCALQSDAQELEAYNREHKDAQVFVISYDDFNPFLDHFRHAARAQGLGKALESWRLQDHMDAILSLGVTKLVDGLTNERSDLSVP